MPIKHFCLSILACFVLCSCNSCASHPAYPTSNPDEVKWKQDYEDGKIEWDYYKAHRYQPHPPTKEGQ